MTKKVIKHALFTYATPDGGEAVALRGQTVDLSDEDVARGERFDAFTDGGAPQPVGQLSPYPLDGGQAEQDAWVTNGTVEEIVDAVGARPEIAASVVTAEQRRGASARKTLLSALSESTTSSVPTRKR